VVSNVRQPVGVAPGQTGRLRIAPCAGSPGQKVGSNLDQHQASRVNPPRHQPPSVTGPVPGARASMIGPSECGVHVFRHGAGRAPLPDGVHPRPSDKRLLDPGGGRNETRRRCESRSSASKRRMWVSNFFLLAHRTAAQYAQLVSVELLADAPLLLRRDLAPSELAGQGGTVPQLKKAGFCRSILRFEKLGGPGMGNWTAGRYKNDRGCFACHSLAITRASHGNCRPDCHRSVVIMRKATSHRGSSVGGQVFQSAAQGRVGRGPPKSSRNLTKRNPADFRMRLLRR